MPISPSLLSFEFWIRHWLKNTLTRNSAFTSVLQTSINNHLVSVIYLHVFDPKQLPTMWQFQQMWWFKNSKFPILSKTGCIVTFRFTFFALNGSLGKKSFQWSSLKNHINYPIFLSFSLKNIPFHYNYFPCLF